MPVKIAATAAAVLLLVLVVIAQSVAAVAGSLLSSPTTSAIAGADCALPIADIPPGYCQLYLAAAAQDCPGLDWTVLAAIGKVETNHGRLTAPGVTSGENSAGAGGPMQFLAPTFAAVVAAHRLPPGGASPPSRYDPHDAIHAAAFLLCDTGATTPGGLWAAIFAYNHAEWYVDRVLAQARIYAQAAAVITTTGAGSGDCTAIRAPNAATLAAINYACGQRGLPYVWGGDGPAEGDAGFDCSGLTAAAYTAAGITLPRTAQTQYSAGPHVPAGQPLLPGDLVFYGTPTRVHHVGLYLGNNLMINAPTFGKPVQEAPYRYRGDDYVGATRPAGSMTTAIATTVPVPHST